MRTSAVGFTPSFFRPLVSDEAGPSRPTGQKQEPLIYSSQKHGRLEEFIARADFKQFQDEYKAVLKSIKDFVHRHANDLIPPLSDEIRNKVDANFAKLEERLFDPRGGGFDTPVAKENMYGAGKRIFHEFVDLLQDKGILLQNRMDAVRTLTKRLEFCFGGIASDLSDATAILMACKYGLKGHAQQWKMEMLNELILQHVKDNHYPYIPGEEIHFVNAYYNYLADEMGVAQREDDHVRAYQGNIHPEQLEACKRHARANLTPMRLAAYAADHYRSRIEEFLSKENIKKDEIDEDGFNKLKEMMKALIPEYGDVALPVVVEPDPDTYQLAYSGRQQPVRGTRHFLKAFRKLEVIDYDKQSKVVLGQIEEGRIVMRDDLLWVKERKHAPVDELTASSLFKLAPEELLANMEKAEPEDMEVCSAMLRKVVHRVHEALTAEGDTEEQLDGWLRGFAVAMKERPSWPQGWTDPVMLLAVSFGQASALRDLLEAGADIKAKDGDGKTVLILSVERGDVGVVEALIENGADIETKDQRGKTPLMLAVENGHIEVVKALIENEAEIEAEDEDGNTPLILALMSGHVRMVKALIENGADIEAEDEDGKTPLMLAAENGHIEMVQALIENEAEIEAEDEDGNTPLMLAVENGHIEVAKALIAKGANTDEIKEKLPKIVLLDLIGHTQQEIMEKLQEFKRLGIDVQHVGNEEGKSVLHLAVGAVNQLHMFKKENDVLPDEDDDLDVYQALQKTDWSGESSNILISSLIKFGIDVNAQDSMQRTPLFAAGTSEALTRELIEQEANVNASMKNGCTPIFAAYDQRVSALLVQHGADPNHKNNEGLTPLRFSIVFYNLGAEIFQGLIKAGATIDEEFRNDVVSKVNPDRKGTVPEVEADAASWIRFFAAEAALLHGVEH